MGRPEKIAGDQRAITVSLGPWSFWLHPLAHFEESSQVRRHFQPTRRRNLGLDSGAVGIAAAFSVGLPTLWVTWAAYRDARRSGTLGC